MRALAIRGWEALRDLDNRLWLPDWLTRHVDLIFRVTLSLIFIFGGLGHFFGLQGMLERIKESPWRDQVEMIGDPTALLWLSGAAFVVFGLLLMFGRLRRLSALILFVTLVPVTVAIHIAPGHVGPLFKNVAILGALLLVYGRGTVVR